MYKLFNFAKATDTLDPPDIIKELRNKKKIKRIKDINPFLERSILNLNRQFLHAKTIGFFHPKKKKEMFFNSNLPKELEIILKMLRKASK